MGVMAKSVFIMVIASLYGSLYLLSPVVANALFALVVAVTSVTAIHAWYTRRSFGESFSVLTSPFALVGGVIWDVGEMIRRDEPPTADENEDTDDIVSAEDIQQQYVNGDIETVEELETELERVEALGSNIENVDEFEAEASTATID